MALCTGTTEPMLREVNLSQSHREEEGDLNPRVGKMELPRPSQSERRALLSLASWAVQFLTSGFDFLTDFTVNPEHLGFSLHL